MIIGKLRYVCDRGKVRGEMRQGKVMKNDAEGLGIKAGRNISIGNYCEYTGSKSMNSHDKQQHLTWTKRRRMGYVWRTLFLIMRCSHLLL